MKISKDMDTNNSIPYLESRSSVKEGQKYPLLHRVALIIQNGTSSASHFVYSKIGPLKNIFSLVPVIRWIFYKIFTKKLDPYKTVSPLYWRYIRGNLDVKTIQFDEIPLFLKLAIQIGDKKLQTILLKSIMQFPEKEYILFAQQFQNREQWKQLFILLDLFVNAPEMNHALFKSFFALLVHLPSDIIDAYKEKISSSIEQFCDRFLSDSPWRENKPYLLQLIESNKKLPFITSFIKKLLNRLSIENSLIVLEELLNDDSLLQVNICDLFTSKILDANRSDSEQMLLRFIIASLNKENLIIESIVEEITKNPFSDISYDFFTRLKISPTLTTQFIEHLSSKILQEEEISKFILALERIPKERSNNSVSIAFLNWAISRGKLEDFIDEHPEIQIEASFNRRDKLWLPISFLKKRDLLRLPLFFTFSEIEATVSFGERYSSEELQAGFNLLLSPTEKASYTLQESAIAIFLSQELQIDGSYYSIPELILEIENDIGEKIKKYCIDPGELITIERIIALSEQFNKIKNILLNNSLQKSEKKSEFFSLCSSILSENRKKDSSIKEDLNRWFSELFFLPEKYVASMLSDALCFTICDLIDQNENIKRDKNLFINDAVHSKIKYRIANKKNKNTVQFKDSGFSDNSDFSCYLKETHSLYEKISIAHVIGSQFKQISINGQYNRNELKQCFEIFFNTTSVELTKDRYSLSHFHSVLYLSNFKIEELEIAHASFNFTNSEIKYEIRGVKSIIIVHSSISNRDISMLINSFPDLKKISINGIDFSYKIEGNIRENSVSKLNYFQLSERALTPLLKMIEESELAKDFFKEKPKELAHLSSFFDQLLSFPKEAIVELYQKLPPSTRWSSHFIRVYFRQFKAHTLRNKQYEESRADFSQLLWLVEQQCIDYSQLESILSHFSMAHICIAIEEAVNCSDSLQERLFTFFDKKCDSLNISNEAQAQLKEQMYLNKRREKSEEADQKPAHCHTFRELLKQNSDAINQSIADLFGVHEELALFLAILHVELKPRVSPIFMNWALSQGKLQQFVKRGHLLKISLQWGLTQSSTVHLLAPIAILEKSRLLKDLISSEGYKFEYNGIKLAESTHFFDDIKETDLQNGLQYLLDLEFKSKVLQEKSFLHLPSLLSIFYLANYLEISISYEEREALISKIIAGIASTSVCCFFKFIDNVGCITSAEHIIAVCDYGSLLKKALLYKATQEEKEKFDKFPFYLDQDMCQDEEDREFVFSFFKDIPSFLVEEVVPNIISYLILNLIKEKGRIVTLDNYQLYGIEESKCMSQEWMNKIVESKTVPESVKKALQNAFPQWKGLVTNFQI